MCLAGAVAGLSPFTVMTNIFVTEFSEFSEIFLGKTQVVLSLVSASASVGCSPDYNIKDRKFKFLE